MLIYYSYPRSDSVPCCCCVAENGVVVAVVVVVAVAVEAVDDTEDKSVEVE